MQKKCIFLNDNFISFTSNFLSAGSKKEGKENKGALYKGIWGSSIVWWKTKTEKTDSVTTTGDFRQLTPPSQPRFLIYEPERN